jgi:hypothetical protein
MPPRYSITVVVNWAGIAPPASPSIEVDDVQYSLSSNISSPFTIDRDTKYRQSVYRNNVPSVAYSAIRGTIDLPFSRILARHGKFVANMHIKAAARQWQHPLLLAG